ncbi:MAG: glucosyltransferase domain-containing protein, partial [Clostridia bacterium]|nr:glucosyltransferase domain-containing protein [Clostridia bacterium]
MKKKIRPFLFIILYFLSACSFLTLICEFRSLKIKIFLTIAAVAICAFNFTKNKALLFKKGSKNIVEMALCIETICFFDFYFNAVHTRPQSLLKIADILSLDKIFNESNIFAIIGLLLCLIGFLFVKTISPYFLKVTNKVIYILKENSFSFFAILSVCIVSFIAIIRANFYYIDDLGRAIYGYGITGDFSRYIANMLSEIFHGNSWLADISPLPQLIALVIISITAILLLHIMSKTIDKKTTKWSFLSLIPICISPYFLSCLSYKYDAPYMALSILVSILPLIFFKYNTAFYSVTVFISMLTMCMTYQVSSGIFPMLVMIMALLMWTQKTEYKKLFRFI